MALITEDGSGRPDAESFCSVAEATTRHKLFGRAAWVDLDTADKEAFLRRATQYLETMYRARWKGQVQFEAQALSWPRHAVVIPGRTPQGYLVPGNSVPADIRNACADLALRCIDGELAPDVGPAVVREKVGQLEVEYAQSTRDVTVFRDIDMMIGLYLSGSAGSASSMMKLVRS